MKLDDIDFGFKIPDFPKSLPVFRTSVVTQKQRSKTLERVAKLVGLGKTYTVEVEDSVYVLAKEGAVQYYRPSGAIWSRNLGADLKYETERRPWKTEKTKVEGNEDDYELVLSESLRNSVIDEARTVFEDLKLLGEQSYLADISLEQIAQIDEKGNEVARFVGEAVAKFLYKVNSIPVDGGGAKSYIYFNPSDGGPKPVGIYHAWREIGESKTVELLDAREGLGRAFKVDKELQLHYEKKHRIHLRGIELVYYAFPPYMFQNYLFPVFRVTGSISAESKDDGIRGFDFSKYFHAATPHGYAKAEIYAQYFASQL